MSCKPTPRETAALSRLLALAVAEDLATGDVTGALLDTDVPAEGHFHAREAITVCGASMLEQIASAYSDEIRTNVTAQDG